MDQAEQLRLHLQQMNKPNAKSIAVISGKGGVGKSNFSINFAIRLVKNEKRVLVLDLDIGYGNIDILIGQSSDASILDFFNQKKELDEMIYSGPGGFDFISGGTGLSYLFKIEKCQFDSFFSKLESLFNKYDYIIFDMGAGMTAESLKFILSADELMVVTTSEPTSITDAYSVIKQISMQDKSIPISIVVNRSDHAKAARETSVRMQAAIEQFLAMKTSYAGWMPDDRFVSQAVIRQIPFTLLFPKSAASRALHEIADNYLDRGKKDLSLHKKPVWFLP
ncbi:MinD/ParA family protein [Bacillus sp. V2I10]|uniref:MinD/ParA family protein n=1 Tax=Bacillus sp. V2I10 TaxID=3042276 RepID=UPI0027880E58|nr:MinD/ParA family protein [Bacillus sp. V2I10]MDQ0860109.1 flagellar biosynthesis protein FlhG [Bacillus sp. V2I10]